MRFTDIHSQGWIEKLPQDARPYCYLMRLDRPIGWWLLLLPAWWAILLESQDTFSLQTILLMGLFWVGAIIMRGAGCVMNDIWDKDLDKQVERTANRPLAAGTISTEDALIFLIILLLAGLMILVLLPWSTIVLGVLSLPLIATYPLTKRFSWWPQAFLGLTFNFGVLMGGTAASGVLSLPVFILYLACIAWTVGYDTIYAHQDKEDDQKIGIKSTALLFGKKSRQWVYGFYSLSFVLAIIACLLQGSGWLTLLGLTATACYTGLQLKNWDPEDQNSSLATFKVNRQIGLMILIALTL